MALNELGRRLGLIHKSQQAEVPQEPEYKEPTTIKIESVQGEARDALVAKLDEIMDSFFFSPDDFNLFVSGMIRLTGGERTENGHAEEEEDRWIRLDSYSNGLDLPNGQTVTFERYKRGEVDYGTVIFTPTKVYYAENYKEEKRFFEKHGTPVATEENLQYGYRTGSIPEEPVVHLHYEIPKRYKIPVLHTNTIGDVAMIDDTDYGRFEDMHCSTGLAKEACRKVLEAYKQTQQLVTQ